MVMCRSLSKRVCLTLRPWATEWHCASPYFFIWFYIYIMKISNFIANLTNIMTTITNTEHVHNRNCGTNRTLCPYLLLFSFVHFKRVNMKATTLFVQQCRYQSLTLLCKPCAVIQDSSYLTVVMCQAKTDPSKTVIRQTIVTACVGVTGINSSCRWSRTSYRAGCRSVSNSPQSLVHSSFSVSTLFTY